MPSKGLRPLDLDRRSVLDMFPVSLELWGNEEDKLYCLKITVYSRI